MSKIFYFLVLFCTFFFNSHAQDKINLKDDFSGTLITYSKLVNSARTEIDGFIYRKINNQVYKRIYDGKINVKWFGAVGNGITDDSKAIQKAFEVGESIFFPAGIYKFSATINKRFEIEGDSGNTIFQPIDQNKAVITFRTMAPYFTYSSIISNIQFHSQGKRGIGVIFGSSDTNNKSIADEYSGNVVFRNVNFKGFQKAVYFPYGNIGSNFYSCSFQLNEYGIYSLDNKAGGDVMHAGNKYFYGCEFDSNDIAVYFHNNTDGFGGISFNDCIFQSNTVNGYFYSNNTYIPIIFQNCWDEKGKKVGEVFIDQYDGKKLVKKSFTPASYIFDGKNSNYLFIGGRLINISVLGSGINVYSQFSKVEFQKEASADVFTIKDNSSLNLYYPSTDQGLQATNNIKVIGIPTLTGISVSPINPEARFIPLQDNFSALSTKEFFSVNFNKIVNLSGSFEASKPLIENLKGKQINNVNLNFNNRNQFITISESNRKLQRGYYFVALALKINSGSPIAFIWDRNENQLVRFRPITDGNVHYYGAYAFVEKPADYFIDISSSDSKPVNLSFIEYKIYKFETMKALQIFLDKNLH